MATEELKVIKTAMNQCVDIMESLNDESTPEYIKNKKQFMKLWESEKKLKNKVYDDVLNDLTSLNITGANVYNKIKNKTQNNDLYAEYYVKFDELGYGLSQYDRIRCRMCGKYYCITCNYDTYINNMSCPNNDNELSDNDNDEENDNDNNHEDGHLSGDDNEEPYFHHEVV
jgi:hypothetical protein